MPYICTVFDYFWCFFRHGMYIDQYEAGEFWRWSNHARKGAVTNIRSSMLRRRYCKSTHFKYLLNKNLFLQYFKDYVTREWVFLPEATYQDFEAFCSKHKSFICKPDDSQQGKGISIMEVSLDVDLHALYEELKSGNCLLEELIVQNSQMCFGSHSVNTVRLLTVLDKVGKSHIVEAQLRIGRGDSVVDNLSAGGVLYQVDIDGGYVVDFGYDKQGNKVVFHPGIDRCLVGYRLPNWQIVKNAVLESAKNILEIRIIGWDVAITEAGVELVEGNHNPDYFTMKYGTKDLYRLIKSLI